MTMKELETFSLRKADYNEIMAFIEKNIREVSLEYIIDDEKYYDILIEETDLRIMLIEGTLGFYELAQSLEEEVHIYLRTYKKLIKTLKRTRQKHPYTILKEPDTVINYLEENFSRIIENQKKI